MIARHQPRGVGSKAFAIRCRRVSRRLSRGFPAEHCHQLPVGGAALRHGLRVAELVDLAVGSNRLRRISAPCTPREAGHPGDASACRSGASRPAAAPARGPAIRVRIPIGTWHTVQHGGFCQDGRASRRRGGLQIRGSSPHASACLWLCAGQCRPRHPVAASLSRAQKHSAHSALHGVVAGTVQKFLVLEGLRSTTASPLVKRTIIETTSSAACRRRAPSCRTVTLVVTSITPTIATGTRRAGAARQPNDREHQRLAGLSEIR
jgi:hypothetical protein